MKGFFKYNLYTTDYERPYRPVTLSLNDQYQNNYINHEHCNMTFRHLRLVIVVYELNRFNLNVNSPFIGMKTILFNLYS